MKRKKYSKIFISLIVLTLTMLIWCFPLQVKAESLITITIEESEKGIVTTTYNGEETTKDWIVQIPSGSKVSLLAEPKAGYRFGGWLTKSGSKYLYISEKDRVSFSSLTKNYTLIPYFILEDSYVVKFYETNDEKSQVLLSIQEVKEGEDAQFDFAVPKVKGVSFKTWSSSYENVNQDLSLRPIYKASVWSVFRDYYGLFLKGLGITLLFSVISVALALLFGGVLCYMRLSQIKVVSILATSYIEVVRGVPLLLQLLVIYMLVPRIELFGFISTEVIACILSLFLNSAAYVAEIFRSGMQAVDQGQTEAALALGLSRTQMMWKIVIPQGIRNSLPSIGNELIAVIKETSLASTIDMSIGELMSVKKMITAGTFINIEPFIIIAVLYFVVTFSLSKVVRFIERRLANCD